MRYEEAEGRRQSNPGHPRARRCCPGPNGRGRIAPPAKEVEYRIVGADGRTYGPVDAAQLRKWIAQGYANEHTWVRRRRDGTGNSSREFPEFADTLRANPTPTNLLGTPPPGSALGNASQDRSRRAPGVCRRRGKTGHDSSSPGAGQNPGWLALSCSCCWLWRSAPRCGGLTSGRLVCAGRCGNTGTTRNLYVFRPGL